jgi:hypothetical protein
MFIAKWLISLICIILCSQANGQIIYSIKGDPFLVSLSAKFVEIDSQFYILPKLDINKKNLKVRVPKKRIYVDGNFIKKNADAKILLLKQIGNSYAYITLGKLDDYANSLLEKKEYINFPQGAALKDTILLQDIFPLDEGNYIAIVELSFWDGKKKKSITSPEVYFKILHKPKDSIY